MYHSISPVVDESFLQRKIIVSDCICGLGVDLDEEFAEARRDDDNDDVEADDEAEEESSGASR